MHLDVRVDDLGPATLEAERLGARRIGSVHIDTAGSFQVLLDPEGNEWCLVRPATTSTAFGATSTTGAAETAPASVRTE